MITELKIALRQLRKSPAFTVVILLTLAFCIGANSVIYSMVYALMLKPLPYAEPSRIVEIYNTFAKAGINKMPSSLPQYNDYKTNARSFSAVGMWGLTRYLIGEEGKEEPIQAATATAEMFDILKVKPVIGRFFTLRNSLPGEDKVIVLTQSYWKSHFREDPGVIGQTLRLDGQSVQIIGVAPQAIEAFDARVKFVRPIAWTPDRMDPRMRFGLGTPLFARLNPNVPVGHALAEALALERRFYEAAPPFTRGFLDRTGQRIAVVPVQTERVHFIKSSLYLLEGGVVFVLLIGCLNVANLLLARANERQGELAIRFALGATRGAIARQLFAESLLLVLAGGALGIGLAWGALHAVNYFGAQILPNMPPFAIDRQVLGFTVFLTALMGVLIGVLPVEHILRSNLAELIHRSSRLSSRSRGVRRLGTALVTGQIAVALVLLVGAGLLIHSFANALAVDPGFDPQNLVTGRISLVATYQNPERSAAFQKQLLRALSEIPGTNDVALATGVPFLGGLPVNALSLKDGSLPPEAPQPGAFHIGVSVGYFQALHLRLLQGRFLEEADTKLGRHNFVVDERFARRYFRHGSALGRRFTFGKPPEKDSDWSVIVGVVRNIPHNGVEDKTNTPFVYYPILSAQPDVINLFWRTPRPMAESISLVRGKLREIDPSISLFDTRLLQTAMDKSFDNRRAVMFLLGTFAVLALLLSAIGIYGVLAYDVSQRAREIGVRSAIGGTPWQITAMIMWQGLCTTGLGLVIGLLAAALLSRTMASLLFNLSAIDPWAYAGVSLLLAAVAALASFLPARRAARINPIEALRIE